MQQVFQESERGMRIQAGKSNWFARIFYISILAMSIFIVISAGVIWFLSGEGFKIIPAVGVVLFLFIGWYSLRKALWNFYGKEIIMFENNEMTYTADYRMFSDKTQRLELSTETTIEIIDYKNDGTVYLKCKTGKDKIETTILVPKGQFRTFNWKNMEPISRLGIAPILDIEVYL